MFRTLHDSIDLNMKLRFNDLKSFYTPIKKCTFPAVLGLPLSENVEGFVEGDVVVI